MAALRFLNLYLIAKPFTLAHINMANFHILLSEV